MSLLPKTLGLTITILISQLSYSEQPEFVAAKQIRAIGGHAFLNLKTNRIGEINLNRNPKATDKTMEWVAHCREITDLSLEQTDIGDAGLTHITGMPSIEWLNLYQTKVTAQSSSILVTLPNLRHLPIGETGITDTALLDIGKITGLRYLGLRGTKNTDRGIANLTKLENLTGLHL